MTGEVSHAAYELRFREPIVTAKGRIEKRRGFLFGVSVGEKRFVSDASLLPEFGTEHFEHAERVLRMETANFASAPATLFGLDCIRWASARAISDKLEVPVAKLLSKRASTGLCDEAAKVWKHGFVSAKLKVGVQDFAKEIEIVEYAHEIAPDLKLRLDANFGWSRDILLQLGKSSAKEAVEWVEDPFSDSEDWQELREQSGIPLASDEAFTPKQLKQISTWKKFDVLVVKPERFGPIAELEQICARARLEGKKVVFSSMYASGVGLAHIAALAQEYGSGDVAHGLGTSGIFEEDLLGSPLEIQNGRLRVPPLDQLAELLRHEWRERLGFASA